MLKNMEEKTFLASLEKMTYPEIFNYRTRSDMDFWADRSILTIKKSLLANENRFPTNKNVLYIHIPFCVTRCGYCPYYTASYRAGRVDAYLDALEKEICMVKHTPYVTSTQFQCVYIGGGTPSLLKEVQLKRLADKLFNSFSLIENPELTFESNASTLNEKKIRILKEAGFNRVSLGIQSFKDDVLKKMGCAHTSEKAIQIIDLLLENGFVVNLDIIFGLIDQTKRDWQDELNSIVSLKNKPQHLSLFPLRLVYGTPLYNEMEKKGNLALLAHNERLLEYNQMGYEMLGANAYIREEIPVSYYHENARPHQYTSIDARVLGLGSSSGTLLDWGDTSNHPDVEKYIEAIYRNEFPTRSGIPLTQRQTWERYIWFIILYFNRSLPNFKEVLQRKFEAFYHTEVGTLYDDTVENLLRIRFVKVGEKETLTLTNRLLRILTKLNIGVPSII